MTIREFYTKYNLNRTYFSEMAHVGVRTLAKYEKGITIRPDTKDRIETAIRIVVEHNLIRPKFEPGEAMGFFGYEYRYNFRKKVKEYMNEFQKLLKDWA